MNPLMDNEIVSNLYVFKGDFEENVTRTLDKVSTLELVPTTSCRLKSLKDAQSKKNLNTSYEPSEYDVICGRGKGHYNQPGNKRFRKIIVSYLHEYKNLKSKIDKTLLLNRIIDDVRSQNNGKAKFIRRIRKNNCWEELGDEHSREKVGHAIREALAPRYKAKNCFTQNDELSNNQKERNENDKECVSKEMELVGDDMYEPLPLTYCNISLTFALSGYINELKPFSVTSAHKKSKDYLLT